MSKKDRCIRELEAEVEELKRENWELKVTVDTLRSRLKRHYDDEIARLQADLTVGVVRRVCFDACKAESWTACGRVL